MEKINFTNKRAFIAAAFFTIVLLQGIAGRAQIITTIGGTGNSGYNGDNGPATAANLNYPGSVAVDRAGNVYIADGDNYVIRKISAADNTISTIAGNGTSGYSGDNGPATAAEISAAGAIAIDMEGDIYISDKYRIRKVNTAGIITTVAGNGAYGSTGDGGLATDAAVATNGVAVDVAGNIYIVDYYSNSIRKVDITGTINTVAGNGTPGETGNGGPATDAELGYPESVAVDAAGDIYIANNNGNVRKVNESGIISLFAGTINGANTGSGDGGPAVDATLTNPNGMAIDAAGNVLIADTYGQVIRKVNVAGIISTVAGCNIYALGSYPGYNSYNGDGILADTAMLNYPYGVAVDASGYIYVADTHNQRIRKITPLPCDSIVVASIGNSGENSFCTSGSDTLTIKGTGGPGTAYQWQSSTDSITWTNVGTDSIRYATGILNTTMYYRNIVTCSIYNTADTTKIDVIAIHPVVVPAVSITATPSGVVPGGYVTFTATATNAGTNPVYKWYKNGILLPGANSSPFAANDLMVNDHISATVFSNIVCAQPDSAMSNVITLAPLGVSEVTADGNNVQLYPNPNNGQFNIEGTILNGKEAQIEVLNVIGQVVYSAKVPVQNGKLSTQITLAGKNADGVYLVRVKTDSGSEVIRFVIGK